MADYTTVNVLNTVATSLTSGLTGTGYKTILVENGGPNPIYCSPDPAVTVNTGHEIAANDGWRSFPWNGPLYAIAATADQDGTGRNHAIIWGSYK